MNTDLRVKEEVLAPTKQINELVDRFGQVQEDLKTAMTQVKDSNTEIKELKTGFFSGITGKTDAQIADHVKKLGLNLYATQKVVMFLIELSHVKNEVLRGFYDNVVSKLIELDKEHDGIAGDLNVSQKNERKIVYQIKEQIESRLALEDSIDANATSIEKNSGIINSNQSNIHYNSSRIEENKQIIDDNRALLSGIEQQLQNHSILASEQSVTLVKQQQIIDELAKQLAEFQKGSDRDINSSKRLIHFYGIIGIIAFSLALTGIVI